MVIAALAWNLKAWFAMMLHRKIDRRRYLTMEWAADTSGLWRTKRRRSV